MSSRWLPFMFAFGTYACGSWHGPGVEGCSLQGTPDDSSSSSEGGTSTPTTDAATTPNDAATVTTDAGPTIDAGPTATTEAGI